jgi:hypothetical protein
MFRDPQKHFTLRIADWSQMAGGRDAPARIFVCRRKLISGSSQQGLARDEHEPPRGCFEKSWNKPWEPVFALM